MLITGLCRARHDRGSEFVARRPRRVNGLTPCRSRAVRTPQRAWPTGRPDTGSDDRYGGSAASYSATSTPPQTSPRNVTETSSDDLCWAGRGTQRCPQVLPGTLPRFSRGGGRQLDNGRRRETGRSSRARFSSAVNDRDQPIPPRSLSSTWSATHRAWPGSAAQPNPPPDPHRYVVGSSDATTFRTVLLTPHPADQPSPRLPALPSVRAGQNLPSGSQSCPVTDRMSFVATHPAPPDAIRNFGVDLSSHLMMRLASINRELTRQQFRPKRASLNISGLANITTTPRNLMAQILSGELLPDLAALRRILKAADTPTREWPAWEARLEGLTGAGRNEVTRRHSYYQPTNDDLYEINRWTRAMPLQEVNNHIHVRQPRTSLQLPREVQRRAADFAQLYRGQVSCVTAIGEVDWNEGHLPDVYDLDVVVAPYCDAIAQREVLEAKGEWGAELRMLAGNADWNEIIERLPRCAIAAQVAVVTADSFALAGLRSANVKNYRSQWSLGINETMKAPSGEAAENFFDLTARAMKEELGIGDADVSDTQIDWFGLCLDCQMFYVFSSVAVRLDCRGVARSHGQARDARELAALEFIPLPDVDAIVDGGGSPDGKPWLHHARLSARLIGHRFRT